MRTIKDTVKVELKVQDFELIDNKYLPFTSLSQKLADREEADSLPYKALRSRMYNSYHCNKLNIVARYGVKCIDIEKPMLKEHASIVLAFKRG